MPNRMKIFAALLPIAAIGLMAAEALESAAMPGPLVMAEATTLDAAPRTRGPIRGARPAPEQPADAERATTDNTASMEGHPRRPDGSRALPQTGIGFVSTASELRLTSPRGARY